MCNICFQTTAWVKSNRTPLYFRKKRENDVSVMDENVCVQNLATILDQNTRVSCYFWLTPYFKKVKVKRVNKRTLTLFFFYKLLVDCCHCLSRSTMWECWDFFMKRPGATSSQVDTPVTPNTGQDSAPCLSRSKKESAWTTSKSLLLWGNWWEICSQFRVWLCTKSSFTWFCLLVINSTKVLLILHSMLEQT